MTDPRFVYTLPLDPDDPRFRFQRALPLHAAKYAAVKALIDREGQREAIEVDEDGAILSGNHRLRACLELGIEPKLVVRSGPGYETEQEKLRVSILRNYDRRTPGFYEQGLAIIAMLESYGVKRGSGGDRRSAGARSAPTFTSVAEELGIPLKTAHRFEKKVRELQTHPDLVVAIDAGDITESDARRTQQQRDQLRLGLEDAGEPAMADVVRDRVTRARDQLAQVERVFHELTGDPNALLQAHGMGDDDPEQGRLLRSDFLMRDAADLRRLARYAEELASLMRQDSLWELHAPPLEVPRDDARSDVGRWVR